MSQSSSASTFVVQTSGEPVQGSPTTNGHSSNHRSPQVPRSPEVILSTASINENSLYQPGSRAPVLVYQSKKTMGHRRTGSDASQKRQQFAETLIAGFQPVLPSPQSAAPSGHVASATPVPAAIDATASESPQINQQKPVINGANGPSSLEYSGIPGTVVDSHPIEPSITDDETGTVTEAISGTEDISRAKITRAEEIYDEPDEPDEEQEDISGPNTTSEPDAVCAVSEPLEASAPALADTSEDATARESEAEAVDLRRRNYSLRHCQSEFVPGLNTEYPQSMVNAKDKTIMHLQIQLNKAQEELKLKSEDCDKLSQLRVQIDKDLEELTAELFTEANRQVQEAMAKAYNSHKKYEDERKIREVLQQQIDAMKELVVHSTPSSPNHHLNPQLAPPTPTLKERLTKKSHRRSTSHHDFTKESRERAEEEARQQDIKEIDDTCFDEFQRWKQNPNLMDETSPFLRRLFVEDVQPCLNFSNRELVDTVVKGAKLNSVSIEPINGDNSFPRTCSLTNRRKLCSYKIKLPDSDDFHPISNMCRIRVVAVVELYRFLEYVSKDLIKWADKEMFVHISSLRLNMAKARLGC